MNRAVTRMAVFAMSAMLSACVQGPVAPGGIVHLTFAGAADLNPGPDGTPNPVPVRIYALKAREAFMNSDYFQLADKDRAVLGSSLLFRQDVTVRPGSNQTIDSTVLPGEDMIGITVGYRNIDHATWRLTAPLLAAQTFRLDADKIVSLK